MANAFLPLLAVLAISAFVPMVYDSTLTLSESLLSAIVQFASYFFTYFISSYMLSVFYPELVKTKTALDRLNDYILYNLIYLVLLSIANRVCTGVLPDAIHALDCLSRCGIFGCCKEESDKICHYCICHDASAAARNKFFTESIHQVKLWLLTTST